MFRLQTMHFSIVGAGQDAPPTVGYVSPITTTTGGG